MGNSVMLNFAVQLILRLRNRFRTSQIVRYYRKQENGKIVSRFNLSDIRHVATCRPELYPLIFQACAEYNLKHLQAKKRIKVAFILYSASMWSCDELYRLFQEDPRFEPYIILSRYTLDANQTTFPTFQKSLQAFKNTNYHIVILDQNLPKQKCYAAMGEPDIVFFLTPYNVLVPIGQNECYLPASVLCIYIPYAYMLIKADEKFNSDGMTLSWRHFTDSVLYRQMLIQYSDNYRLNTFFVGYPKMDVYYQPPQKSKTEIWKFPHGSTAKCIIYAPHHSLRGAKKCTAHFSTFDDNFRAVLEYARSHQTETSWIIKPHPNLKMTVLETGLFHSEEEYNAYLAEWNNLPNAKVVEEATYYDIFKTSDAMICDSVSFLAEYQFTGKPLLLLTRPEQEFNEFGRKLAEVLYQVPGNDLNGIKDFIDAVVLEGKDGMKKRRDDFFRLNLDYRFNSQPPASQQIYNHIVSAIGSV